MSFSITGATLEYAFPDEFIKYDSQPVSLPSEAEVQTGTQAPVLYYPVDLLNKSTKLYNLTVTILRTGSINLDDFAIRVYSIDQRNTQNFYKAIDEEDFSKDYVFSIPQSILGNGGIIIEIVQFVDRDTRNYIINDSTRNYNLRTNYSRNTNLNTDQTTIEKIEQTVYEETERYFFNLEIEPLVFPEVNDLVAINDVNVLYNSGTTIQINIPTTSDNTIFPTKIELNDHDFGSIGALLVEYPDGFYYKSLADQTIDTYFSYLSYHNLDRENQYDSDVDLEFNLGNNFLRLTPVLFYNTANRNRAISQGNLGDKENISLSIWRKLQSKVFIFEVTDDVSVQPKLISLNSSTNIISETNKDRRSGGKSQVTFTLTTQGYTDGQNVSYTVSGIDNAKLTFDSPSFTVYSNVATVTATISGNIDEDSTLTLAVENLATSVFVLESDGYTPISKVDPNEPDPNPDSEATPVGYDTDTTIPTSGTSIGTTNTATNAAGQAPLTTNGTADIAYDYSEHFNRAIEALDAIAISQAKIAGHTGLMAEKLNSIDETLKVIKGDIKLTRENIARLRDLADGDRVGTGIRMHDRYRDIESAILWQMYIEQGSILNSNINDNFLDKLLEDDRTELDAAKSAEVRSRSLNRLNAYLTSIRRNLGDGYGDN